MQYLGACFRVELSSETEVDEFDFVTVPSNTQDVLRLQIQMQDVLTVHVLDACANNTKPEKHEK